MNYEKLIISEVLTFIKTIFRILLIYGTAFI